MNRLERQKAREKETARDRLQEELIEERRLEVLEAEHIFDIPSEKGYPDRLTPNTKNLLKEGK